jgi:hypothetical protein
MKKLRDTARAGRVRATYPCRREYSLQTRKIGDTAVEDRDRGVKEGEGAAEGRDRCAE